MARGIDGRDIFGDDNDRRLFLELLARYSTRTGVRCYAWALMTNHYHLVIRTSDRPLAALMKPLNSRYAASLNKKVGRRGYLFQDRFKSVATQDQLYIEEMIRYVHLNPIRAGVCKTIRALDTYPWCGHSAIMGTISNSFQDTATVLRRFGKETHDARVKYRAFLEAGIGAADSGIVGQIRASSAGTDDRTSPGMWVIGDRDFVEHATRQDCERRLRIARHAREGWDMHRICVAVSEALKIEQSSMMKRGRSNATSSARKIVAHLAHRHFEFPVSLIARHFCISQPAVSRMLEQGEALSREHKVVISN